VRRRLRKLRRVGPTAGPVGLALRRAYANAQGELPHVAELPMTVVRVPTLNGPDARAALAGTDVAVSLDNALISEATFSVPAQGTVNVHHGAVPAYRGGPAVFWELADGRDAVGFTVHRIDAGIDTGPVLAAGEVPIERRPTLRETLAVTIPKLHDASLDALERVLFSGDLTGRPQERGGRARTTPTLRDYLRVRRALRNYDQRP
jgi:methionyl-tRNA formyltransferase